MRRRAMAQEMGRQKCKTSFRISIIHYGNPINEHMGVLSTFKNLSVTKSPMTSIQTSISMIQTISMKLFCSNRVGCRENW